MNIGQIQFKKYKSENHNSENTNRKVQFTISENPNQQKCKSEKTKRKKQLNPIQIGRYKSNKTKPGWKVLLGKSKSEKYKSEHTNRTNIGKHQSGEAQVGKQHF